MIFAHPTFCKKMAYFLLAKNWKLECIVIRISLVLNNWVHIYYSSVNFWLSIRVIWYICHGLLKYLHCPGRGSNGDPSIYSRALYHVAIKAGLYKAVQVYYKPNLYPVTFSPSILNSSSNSQEYKNHLK